LRDVLTTPPAHSGGVVFTFDDGYRDFLLNALPVLGDLNIPATLFVPTAKVGHTSDWSWRDTERPVMTWDEFRACQAAGIELESHTATHPDLGKATEPDIVSEFAQARDDLTRHTGVEPFSIAYPYGRSNSRVHSIAARYYRAGLSLGGLWGFSSATDRYQIPRYLVRGDMTAAEILAIARGRWDIRRAVSDTVGRAGRRRHDGR
jgi:peptidoglycan/xylan/chitin deacetylase (PgdA/CDA1 family)